MKQTRKNGIFPIFVIFEIFSQTEFREKFIFIKRKKHKNAVCNTGIYRQAIASRIKYFLKCVKCL